MPSLRADHQDDAGRAPRKTAASFRGYRSRRFVPRGNSLGLSCRPNLLGGPQLEQSPLSMHPCEVRKPPEGGMHPFGGEVLHCRGRAHNVADSRFQWRAGSARQTLPPWHAPDGGSARTPIERGTPFRGRRSSHHHRDASTSSRDPKTNILRPPCRDSDGESDRRGELPGLDAPPEGGLGERHESQEQSLAHEAGLRKRE